MKAAVVLFISFVIFQFQVSIVTTKAIEDTTDSSSDSSPEEDSSSEEDSSYEEDDSSEEEPDLTSKEEACVDELHLDKQLITELNNEEIAPEDNEHFNAFLNCYWQKEEWMDSNGQAKFDKLLPSLLEMAEVDFEDADSDAKSTIAEDIKDAVAYCEANPPGKGNSNGQTAAKLQNCIVNKLSEMTVYFSSEEEMLIFSTKQADCVNDLHLNKKAIAKLNNEEITAVDNEEFNEYFGCYWQKEGFMDSNGEIKYEVLLSSLAHIPETKLKDADAETKSKVANDLKEAVAYCVNDPSTKGNTHGQTAVKVQNCIVQTLKEKISSEEETSVLTQKQEECVDELHLDKQQMIKLNDRDVVPEGNDDFNKFLTCYWMKKEWMDSNGTIKYDNILFALREAAATEYQGETHEYKSMMKKKIAHSIAYCQNNAAIGDTYGQTVAKLRNCIIAKLNKGLNVEEKM